MNEITAVDVLEHAKSLIEPKGAWTKGTNYLAGIPGDIDSFCAWGAIFRAGSELHVPFTRPSYDAQIAMTKVGLSLAYNDSCWTTHRGVVRKFDKAIKYARKHGW